MPCQCSSPAMGAMFDAGGDLRLRRMTVTADGADPP